MTSQKRKLERQRKKRAGQSSSGGAVRDIELSELKAIIARAKAGPLGDADVGKLEDAMDTLALLTRELEAKGASIRRLRTMIFGASTEKTSRVVGASEGATPSDGASSPPTSGDGSEPSQSEASAKGDSGSDKLKRKGHGRNSAAAYTGAEKVAVPHESLRDKQSCPECQRGKVYLSPPPARLVRVTGMAPLIATVYELERLRCNLCGEVFTAKPPEGVGSDKYDETAAAMIALLKYGTGLPWNRIERLERGLGIPLPTSTQWDVVRNAAGRLDAPYAELVHQAACGQVMHNDDTAMKVLELDAPERRKELDTDGDFEGRTGVFTTGIVATADQRHIALFFTGQKHAGENLSDLLTQRDAELSPPIQMCDALSRNVPAEFETLLANCNAHSRRKFVEVAGSFPDEVRHVLEVLSQVYRNDAIAKQQELTAEQRLLLHQTDSGPLLEELQRWFDEQLDERKIEPNSGLGEAVAYMTKHWDELTLFLRVPGAPLDNNVCERVLKKAILHRKNAMFYKTLNGARVGDLFMSLIHTAELAKVNVFDYLVALLRHHERVAEAPSDWMPWNYAQALATLTEPTAST